MALPTMATGKVIGQFLVGDGTTAAVQAAQGIVIFTAAVPTVPNPSGGFTLVNYEIVGVLDSEGWVCSPLASDPSKPGTRGINLAATNAAGVGVLDWTWTITSRFEALPGSRITPHIDPFSFDVPAGATTDLAKVAKVPNTEGTGNDYILVLAREEAKAAVLAAAGPAVDAALENAGVLTGASKVIDPNVAFSVADGAGRQSWLSVGTDGGIPAHSSKILAETLRGTLTGGSALTGREAELDSVAFAVADTSGRRSELEVGTDGRLTQRVIDSIASRLPSSTPRYASKLSCWGDSLTYSQVSTGQAAMPWPETVGQELGVPVFNGGKASHGSADIATRQGGLRPLLTLAGNTIPPSGPVALTAISPTDGWRTGGNYTLTIGQGTLAGVPGVLSHDLGSATRYFTRTTSGAAVSVPPATPFIGADGVGWRDGAHIIWAGTNNTAQQAAILRDIDSMISWIAPYTDRYIILPLTVPAASLNNALVSRYGNHFDDHRAYLIANGLTDAGIAPTAADNTAISNNQIPPSLVYDGTHFTQAGYSSIAKYITRRLRERSFFA